ncbi:MAG: cell division protein FtsZ [Verrucomicrobia bacterium]|nr:cell division protein FtsZ [Verrucomicrobiota bacterium]
MRKHITVKVFGIGGAGGNALDALLQGGMSGVGFAALNTDAQALARSAAAHKLQLGAKLTRGLGAGGDPDRGRAAAEESLPKLRELVKGADLVFIMAGLGGGTGTGASPVVARVAKEAGALVLAVITLPFNCEGSRRQQHARHGFEQLTLGADGVICLPNEAAQKLFDENTSAQEMFQTTNGLLAEGVSGIWRMLALPGLINIDFSDLCSVMRRRHAECRFAAAVGAGKDRARETLEKLFANPLLNGGQLLTEADALLVSLVGGPGLAMAEINRVMETINRQCDGIHLVLGASVDESFGDKLSVTIVASRRIRDGEGSLPLDAVPATKTTSTEANMQFLDQVQTARPASRVVAPAPETTPEKVEQVLKHQPKRRKSVKAMQGVLPLEIISKGRFEKSEPTLRNGEDLDIPTYVRRGMALN